MATKKFARLIWYEGEDEEQVAHTADAQGDLFYLQLLDHPHKPTPGVTARSIDLHVLIDDYIGPRLTLDLDKDHHPIGIEIIYPTDYDKAKSE